MCLPSGCVDVEQPAICEALAGCCSTGRAKKVCKLVNIAKVGKK